eukprot:768808-Hanusia_phi.AAC.2
MTGTPIEGLREKREVEDELGRGPGGRGFWACRGSKEIWAREGGWWGVSEERRGCEERGGER